MSRLAVFALALLVLGGCSTCFPDNRVVDFSIHEDKATPAVLDRAAVELRTVMAKHGLRSMEELMGAPPDPGFVHYLVVYPGGDRRFCYSPRDGLLSLNITGTPEGAAIRDERRAVLTRMVGPNGFDERDHAFCRSAFADSGERTAC